MGDGGRNADTKLIRASAIAQIVEAVVVVGGVTVASVSHAPLGVDLAILVMVAIVLGIAVGSLWRKLSLRSWNAVSVLRTPAGLGLAVLAAISLLATFASTALVVQDKKSTRRATAPTTTEPPTVSSTTTTTIGTTIATTTKTTTPPTTRAIPAASITSPANGAHVSASHGAALTGTVTNLRDDQTLWLLDYDGSDYTPDSQVVPQDGHWSASTGSVGDSGKRTQTEVIMAAVPSCSSFLAAKEFATDSTISVLPPGCTRLASVDLTLDYP